MRYISGTPLGQKEKINTSPAWRNTEIVTSIAGIESKSYFFSNFSRYSTYSSMRTGQALIDSSKSAMSSTS